MGDKNPIRTLGDYFKPSYEGYRNTIVLLVGNNVVPLPSDIIWLVQNKCSFNGLRPEDPNQHLKDLLKLMDLLDLDENLYQKHGLVSRTYSEKSLTMVMTYRFKFKSSMIISTAPPKRALTRQQDDAFIPVEMRLNYESPNIKQLLGIMERKFETLMKDAISLMGRSESISRMTTDEMYQTPSEPSRQEEFEHIVMNFILNQEERVKHLEEYMKVIIGDFLQLSSKFTRGLKEKIMSKRQRSTRGQSSSSQEFSIKEKVRRLGVFENSTHQLHYETLARLPIHSEDVIDWEFLANQGLAHSFLNSINTDPFSGPQWMNLFQINEPVYRELLREFFSSFEFDSYPYRMRVIIKLHNGGCCWLVTRKDEVKEEDEGDDGGDEATGGYVGHERVGGSTDIYRNMCQGDWQVRQARWMDQEDKQ
nr:MAK10-like protein [Tanacetum cinerariifolium]